MGNLIGYFTGLQDSKERIALYEKGKKGSY